MRKTLIAALLAAGLAAPLAAQDAPAPAAQQQQQPADTPADRERAGIILRTFMLAVNSDKIGVPIKNQLVGCLYNNSVRNISVASGKVFAKNTNLDTKNPQQVYAVAAQLCGVKPAQSAQNQAAPATPQSGR